MIPLSVLDLSPITEGGDAARALRNTLDLARHAEAWGYRRFWLAEHHNMPGIASAATAVVIGHVAGGTSTIRVGAGGIMLPNHAPLVVAEQFGTLAALHPGRIDLGLGRAPGTDPLTARALRRNLGGDADAFPQDVVELMAYFDPPEPGRRVRAVPGAGLDVPVWILGSSLFGAQLAAALGLPYAFASHFAPAAMMEAIEVYRGRFRPSGRLAAPYVMLGVNVFAAETEAEARLLKTSVQQSFLALRRGEPGPLPPPVEGFEDRLAPAERTMLDQALSCSVVGTPETVRSGLADFAARDGGRRADGDGPDLRPRRAAALVRDRGRGPRCARPFPRGDVILAGTGRSPPRSPNAAPPLPEPAEPPMPPSPAYRPSTRHADLGAGFYDPVAPAAFPRHVLRHRNRRWAARVGLDALTDEEWVAHFGRFEPLPGGFDPPLALRYHGHQFRAYNPALGDGRGFLFAQLHDARDGRLLDLGTKGSGRTPWSRGADGRLTLKGGVRELLASEMLEALGVETSKAFSLIETGEALARADEPSPTRSAVLVRLSHSHIRIGTFQRFAYLEDTARLRRLLDHAVRTYMPDVWYDDEAARVAAFLARVGANVARTAAGWMAAGFVHGVLNTDNVNITGESFDYGPWRFLPAYDPGFTAAYFDDTGLYAYGRQPAALLWNLARLAECLLPLAGRAELEAALGTFQPAFRRELAAAVLRRLGLRPAGEERDDALTAALFTFLEETRAPFERTFFDWRGGLRSRERAGRGPSAGLYAAPAFAPVAAALAGFEAVGGAGLDRPYFAREEPCTLLLDEVEAIWAAIAERDDWAPLAAKLAEIGQMAAACGTGAPPA